MLRAPLPGAFRFRFLAISPVCSPPGHLLPVAGLGLFVFAILYMLVPLLLVLLLGIELVLCFFYTIVVHLVVSRAMLASGGSLLVPLACSHPTVGSHCVSF